MATLDQQVHVIGHEAVRDYYEAAIVSCTQDVKSHELHTLRSSEGVVPLICAKGQEIAVASKVVKILQVLRTVGEHSDATGKTCAAFQVRLKADTTYEVRLKADTTYGYGSTFW